MGRMCSAYKGNVVSLFVYVFSGSFHSNSLVLLLVQRYVKNFGLRITLLGSNLRSTDWGFSWFLQTNWSTVVSNMPQPPPVFLCLTIHDYSIPIGCVLENTHTLTLVQ